MSSSAKPAAYALVMIVLCNVRCLSLSGVRSGSAAVMTRSCLPTASGDARRPVGRIVRYGHQSNRRCEPAPRFGVDRLASCPPLAPSSFGDHHIGRFDERDDLIAFLEAEIIYRFRKDRRMDMRAAVQIDCDMSHHCALLDGRDSSGKGIARAEFHLPLLLFHPRDSCDGKRHHKPRASAIEAGADG